MASISRALNIRFELEPIVNLSCFANHCRFNNSGTCGLKVVWIGKDGRCQEYEGRNNDSQESETGNRSG